MVAHHSLTSCSGSNPWHVFMSWYRLHSCNYQNAHMSGPHVDHLQVSSNVMPGGAGCSGSLMRLHELALPQLPY